MDALARIKAEMLPFSELLGIEFVHAAADRVVAELTVREALCTRPAVLHGGAIMAFADTLGATGTILNLPEGAGTTTIESKTNFIAAAPLGTRITGERRLDGSPDVRFGGMKLRFSAASVRLFFLRNP